MSGREGERRRVFARHRLALLGAVLAAVALAAIVALTGGDGGTASEATLDARQAALRGRLAARRHARQLGLAVDRAIARDVELRSVPSAGREIALTFDDGPGSETAAILDALERLGAPATFFTIGGVNDTHAALIRRAVEAGHAVENHTVGHPDMSALSRREQAREIDRQTKAIVAMGAPRPRFFRPPYNRYNGETAKLLRKRGMLLTLWSIDPGDWGRPGAEAIAQRVLAEAHPGGIVLLHDGGGDRAQTLAALPPIVRGLRRRGYRLVTLPELLLGSAQPADKQAP